MAGRLTALLVTPEPAPDTDDFEATLGIAGRAIQGGVNAILVRRPYATAREVYEMTRRLRPATRRERCLLLVSDRIDVAIAADADGVHLGARSLPVPAARRILETGMLLGCSVHNLDEAGQAEEQGADYLFLGPIFQTKSHPGQAALGLEVYREACLRSKIPVLAIGGVTTDNVRLVAQAGGAGAAGISAYYGVEDAAESARAFRAAFAK